MSEDEPVIKLHAGEAQEQSVSPVRLKPQHRRRGTISPSRTEPELRVVEESEGKPVTPEIPTLEQEPRRPSFEGKSVDYTIDEIMQPEVTYDPNAIEQEWGNKKNAIPRGWVVLFILFLGGVSYGMYRVLVKNRIAEQSIVSNNLVVNQPTVDTAYDLVQSIDSRVKRYLAARTIDERLVHVRHAAEMRPRMEMYYAKHPLQAEECQLVTNYQPLTVNGRTFWKVLAIKGGNQGEWISLEQISDTEVLIDWDSQVDFAIVPWDDYLREPTFGPMVYRLEVEETHRYVAEFMNESEWACYILTKPKSDGMLYGYVRRNSMTHDSLRNALQNGSNQMILKIQASIAMKARNSVVIQELISDSIFRVDPPKSPKD